MASTNKNNAKLLSIIIVNWNGLQWLKMCLPSVFTQTYENLEVILVDNASSDESVSWTKKNYPSVLIIKNTHNVGFADANNIGYLASRGDCVLFLNNDTIMKKSCVLELLRVLESDVSIGGAQGKILLMDDPARLDAVGAFLTYTGFLYHYGFGAKSLPKFDQSINLFTAKGACMIFKREVLDNVLINNNIFDPTYFAYFEETDLCHRVWLSGHRIVYAPGAIVYHKMGATSTKLSNFYVQFHSFKNRIRSYIKNFGLTNLLLILPIHLLLCHFAAVMFFLKRKTSLAIAIEKAIFWNFVNLRATLTFRYIVQNRIRILSDSEFFMHILRHPPLRYYLLLFRGEQNYEV